MRIYFRYTATTAKSLQLCLTLCDPIDSSPPGSPVPRILQARTLEWVAISFSNAWKWKVRVKSLSCVLLSATPWTAAYQAPLSMDCPGKSTGVGCHRLLWFLVTKWVFSEIAIPSRKNEWSSPCNSVCLYHGFLQCSRVTYLCMYLPGYYLNSSKMGLVYHFNFSWHLISTQLVWIEFMLFLNLYIFSKTPKYNHCKLKLPFLSFLEFFSISSRTELSSTSL